MAIDIVGTDGRSGRVIVKDSRPDGTVILLACDPLNTSGAIIVQPDEKKPEGEPGYPWPVEHGVDRLVAPRPKPFELTVDTSGMPNGAQAFQQEQFVSQALTAAEITKEVQLTGDNAKDWGWRPEATVPT